MSLKKRSWKWSGHAKEQQETILKVLKKSKDEMTQRQIGKATGMNKNTVVKYMKQLEDQKKVKVREFSTALLYKVRR